MANTKRAGHTLAEVDGTGNLDIADVIGNRDDDHSTITLAGRAHMLHDHAHKSQNVYPTLADGIVVTSSAVAWTLGNFIEIIPASTIISPFDLHFLDISSISANDNYELVIYAVEVKIACVSFTKSAGGEPNVPLRIQTPINLANAQIQAKLASKAALARTIELKIQYHIY